MLEVTRKLVELLDVSPTGGDHFQGDSEDVGFPNLFGGQVLGQALMAATRTVDDRMPHSMHAYFLRPGNPRLPVDYEVQRVRDGGSFSVRRVSARQEGREILTCAVSLQIEEQGLEHQFDMPEAPPLDTLRSDQDLFKPMASRLPEKLRHLWEREQPIEFRTTEPQDPLNPQVKPPYAQSWLRVQGELPDDPILHRCLLAYLSDFTLLATSLKPHGCSLLVPDMQIASLDHALWFHREFRIDDWLLYDKDSPSASGGRGLTRGAFFNREGVLVASAAQEGLIRKRG
ncbi:acyl-CoA thioesterase [Marinobacter sp. X15-166B]|uniref:acyl-CoA thioesterase n=1 Tax=Marinobacter sp. X15-166B TaxID=1897620 RepID=UPI00085C9582|nr:acyl-CoA thioesterase II [Marinobacter sp. X15-166B]OEY65762.1 acyl-CoA thioesterase II [Marinobacter sp. X15-166B]